MPGHLEGRHHVESFVIAERVAGFTAPVLDRLRRGMQPRRCRVAGDAR